MLPFALFRRRNFAVANLETFLVYGALGGVFFFFTIYLQFLGFSPLAAGLANVPGSVMMILLAARFGTLADEHGPRSSSPSGPTLIGSGHRAVLVHAQQGRLLARGRAGPPRLLVRAGDGRRADHVDGAQVGARRLLGHRRRA